MDRLDDFRAFVAVIDRGSLTNAARHLGRSIQSVSRSLAALERELGVELVRRTTRHLFPTDAGLLLCSRLKATLAELDDAVLEAANRRGALTGLLRITSSTAFAPLYLVPIIAEFLAAHRGVEIELDLSDTYADLFNRGFDLAVRVGEMPDSPLIAKRLADLRRVVFAAPHYLEAHGRPKRPEDLSRFECIIRTASRESDAWPFTVDDRLEAVNVNGRFRTSSAVAANEAAVLGLGIGNAPLWQVKHLVDCKRLELLLTRFELPPVPVHAVWPATKVPSAKTQSFVEFLAARLRKEQL